jgi:hypothetical protein
MPISASEVRAVVASEDDFGHEMRVGGVIRSIQGLRWEHGGTYTDLVTGKPRQFDYRCWLTKTVECKPPLLESYTLSLAAECKSLSQSAALVVCGTSRRENEATHDLVQSGKVFVAQGSTKPDWSSETWRVSGEDALYPPGAFVGKSLIRLKSVEKKDRKNLVETLEATSESDVYDKWSQAVSSAVELARSACAYARDTAKGAALTAIVPAVVVPEDRLWQVVYDDNGSLSCDPAPVSECSLYVGREIDLDSSDSVQPLRLSHVHFFTLGGFSKFLSRTGSNQAEWANLFKGGRLLWPSPR